MAATRALSRSLEPADVDDISLYRMSREQSEERIARAALNLIYAAIGTLYKAEEKSGGAIPCAFCGRSCPDIWIGAGLNAQICGDCVSRYSADLPKS